MPKQISNPFLLSAVAGVAALVSLSSWDAEAGCLDSHLDALSRISVKASRSLSALDEATLGMALRLDGAIQEETGDTSAIRPLREPNCAQLPNALRESVSALRDPLLVGSDRDLANLRRTYLFTRTFRCRIRRLRERSLPILSSPESAADAVSALNEISRFSTVLYQFEVERNEQAQWRGWAAAAENLVTSTRDARAIAAAIRASCSCERLPAETPLENNLRVIRASIEGIGQALPQPDATAPTEQTQVTAESAQSIQTTERARGSASRRPSRALDETEVERLRREQQERTEALAEQAARAQREMERPASLQPRRHLIRQMRQALRQSMNDEGRLPAELDWAMTRVELEAHARRPRLRQHQLDAIRERWGATQAQLAEIAATESDPTVRLTRAMQTLVANHLTRYHRDEAGVLEALLGNGTNCQGRAHLIVSALSQNPALIPSGYELGIQVFNDHVQAVLVPTDPERHEVWDLLTNTVTSARRAPIFRPATAIRGTLQGQGARTGVSDEALILRAADPEAVISAHHSPIQPRGESMQRGQSWAAGAGTYSAGPIPEWADSTPPAVGQPASVSGEPDASTPTESRRAFPRVAGTGDANESESSRQFRARYQSIQDDRVAALFFRSPALDWTWQTPNLTADQAARQLIRDFDQSLAPSSTPGSSLEIRALSELCYRLSSMGMSCLENASARRVHARIEESAREFRRHPELLIPRMEEVQNNRNRWDEIRKLDNDSDRRRLEVDITREQRQINERGGDFIEGYIHLRSILSAGDYGQGVDDRTTEAEILDYLLDPSNVAPARGESENQRPTASAAPALNTSSGAYQPRVGGSQGSQTPIDPELLATYALEPEAYRRIAMLYVSARHGNTESRERVFATYLSTLASSAAETTGDTSRSIISVCGNRSLDSWQLYSVLSMASALNQANPSVPCPRGSTSSLAPAEEFRQLKAAYNLRNPREPYVYYPDYN